MNKLPPRHVGNGLIETGHHRFRDMSLAQELEAEKRYGFNWRKKLRLAAEVQAKAIAELKARHALSVEEDQANSIAPIEPNKPETEV